MYEIGKGKLWRDATQNVTVPIVHTESGRLRKICIRVADKKYVNGLLESIPELKHLADSKFATDILAVVRAAQQDPEQLSKKKSSLIQAEVGKKKSMNALQQRTLRLKEAAFKAKVQDLMQHGVDKDRIEQLVKDAIVEGVMSS